MLDEQKDIDAIVVATPDHMHAVIALAVSVMDPSGSRDDAAAAAAAGPVDQTGVEYGRPGGHPLLLDLHVPDGPGPFPAAVPFHRRGVS